MLCLFKIEIPFNNIYSFQISRKYISPLFTSATVQKIFLTFVHDVAARIHGGDKEDLGVLAPVVLDGDLRHLGRRGGGPRRGGRPHRASGLVRGRAAAARAARPAPVADLVTRVVDVQPLEYYLL